MTAVESIEAFLKLDEQKELLRFSTAGSVDDGKSTLIGRLLVDSKGVYEDQVASARKASVNQSAGPLDFALLTDGLRAEREQGITIDVAYRYFATARRKFIIADTPGHEQYTRNMATGASTASLAIILVDARNGVLPQSRRHGYIAALLGIPNIVVCVNKMDLMDFRQDVYDRIIAEFGAYAGKLGLKDILYMPVSALLGDNVVTRSKNTPWYQGPALLEYLETVSIHRNRNFRDFRFPVQYVLRPNLDFRGFAGQVVSGIVRKGDSVMVLPSGRVSRVTSIVTYDGAPEEAWPPMSVTLCLEHEIDISRGDMLVHPTSNIHVARRIDAMVVWMNSVPLDQDKTYLLKHTTHAVKATVRAIHHKVDVNSLDELPAAQLEMNEIGSVSIETVRPLFFDPYHHNRGTGAFILIDPMTNETVAAGMIRGALGQEPARQRREESELELTRVTPGERYARSGHRPATVWLSGEPEIAYVAERKLFDRGYHVQVLDEAWPAELLPQLASALNENGVIVLVIAPSTADRGRAHAIVGDERFIAMDFSGHTGEADRAADEAIRRLEAAGFIPASLFDGGEGI
ncbi:MAG: sulfate adenylyltransferase subunit CysN [Bryobacteraceae bacterium]